MTENKQPPIEDDGWIKANDTKVKVFHRPTETWYWFDIMWGNRHATGNGWLCVLEEGEELKSHMFHGDNRMTIDSSDCDIYINPKPQADRGSDGLSDTQTIKEDTPIDEVKKHRNFLNKTP